MMKNFNLKGTSKQNFKKLEKVLTRVFKRLSTKTYGIIPSSILHAYKDVINEDGLIFRCCLFEGKVKKLSFLIDKIDGKERPKYSCSIHSGNEVKTINFETRKLSHTQEVNIDVKDGDFVVVEQVLSETSSSISNVHVSVLMTLTQKDNEIVEQLTDKLTNDSSNPLED